ncbi:zinc-binding oxidoreductase CipB [Xylariaceae sp. FL1651]|nr:zinc-binding oxidoreductase CipB [Xylariaceae sp. FL1651]
MQSPGKTHTNRAAYLTEAKAYPLVVKDAPYTKPGPGELVIRNAAIALNPIDYIKQLKGQLVFPESQYPLVLGWDMAGEVVETGEGITRFRPGDRVVAIGDSDCKRNPESGFQLYTVLKEQFTAPIPGSMSFEQASVMPLGVVTASAALFESKHLGLRLPQPGGNQALGQEADKREIVLIWGGSTSVGCNAIQLAVAAGYEVLTTCSPKNFDLVKSLGASQAFDYRRPGVVADIVAAIGKQSVAGAVAIGPQSGCKCMDVLKRCQGSKSVVMVSFPMPENPDAGMVSTVYHYATGTAGLAIKALRTGTKTSTVFADPKVEGVGKAVWEGFLPEALASGRYVAAPTPQVVGHGLEDIQAGLDMLKKGVSAKKLVISLSTQ